MVGVMMDMLHCGFISCSLMFVMMSMVMVVVMVVMVVVMMMMWSVAFTLCI